MQQQGKGRERTKVLDRLLSRVYESYRLKDKGVTKAEYSENPCFHLRELSRQGRSVAVEPDEDKGA